MNEGRAPDDEEIRAMVLSEYENGAKPKALSEKTGVSINTIKSWITRSKARKTENEKDAPAKKEGAPGKGKKGAPRNNKNAFGHGAPERNKNAETHGAYSSIYWDSLAVEELSLLGVIDYDEKYQLQRQIDLYTVRERRLLVRISEYKAAAEESKGMLVKSITKEKGTEKGKPTNLVKTEREAVMNTIMLLEDALTKVQKAKTKAIDSLMRFRLENRKFDESGKGSELVDDWISSIMGELPAPEEGEDG